MCFVGKPELSLRKLSSYDPKQSEGILPSLPSFYRRTDLRNASPSPKPGIFPIYFPQFDGKAGQTQCWARNSGGIWAIFFSTTPQYLKFLIGWWGGPVFQTLTCIVHYKSRWLLLITHVLLLSVRHWTENYTLLWVPTLKIKPPKSPLSSLYQLPILRIRTLALVFKYSLL